MTALRRWARLNVHPPVSAATPASAMKPTATATERLKPSHQISQSPADERERQRQYNDHRLGDRPDIEAQQQEDDEQRLHLGRPEDPSCMDVRQTNYTDT